MSDRDILFRIGLEHHPQTQARLNELADSVKRTMVSVESSMLSVGARASEASRQIAASVDFGGAGSSSRVTKSLGDSAGGSLGAQADLASVRPGSQGSLDGLREDMRNKAKEVGSEATKAVRKSFAEQIGQLSGLSEADMKKLMGTGDDDLLELAKDQGEQFANGIRAGLRSQLSDGINPGELFSAKGGEGLKQQQKEWAEEGEKLNKQLDQQIEGFSRLGEEGEKTGKALKSNLRDVAERGEQMASGLAQAAQGISFLFADSENAQALIKTLLTVKGTTDLVLGGFKSFLSVGAFFGVLTDRSKLLAERQAQQTQQTRLAEAAAANYVKWLEREGIELLDAVNGNQQHADALMGAARAANAAADAEARLSKERAKPEVRAKEIGGTILGSGGVAPPPAAPRRGGRVGSLLAGAARTFGFDAIAGVTGSSEIASVGSMGIESLLGRIGGGAATVATTPIAGGAAAAGGAGAAAGGGAAAAGGATALAAPIAALAASVAAVAALGKLAWDAKSGEISQDSLSGRVIGGFSTNRTAARVDRFVTRSLGGDNDYAQLADSYDRLDRQEALAETRRQRADQDRINTEVAQIDQSSERGAGAFHRGSESTMRGLGVESGALTQFESASLAAGDAMRELATEQKRIAEYSTGITKSEELHVDALKAANEATQRLVEAQQRQLSALRDEAKLRESISEQSIAASERRIGLLDNESKRIQDMGKAAENSVLTAAEKFARLTDGQQAEAIKAQQIARAGGKLTDKQQDLLSSVGGAEGQDAVRRQNLEEARQKGFFQTFQGSEQRLAATAESSRLSTQARDRALAQQRLQATVAGANVDGRISLEERKQIESAQQSFREVQLRQEVENRGRAGDRRRAAGFSVEQNAADAERLAVNDQATQKIGLEITRQVEFQVVVKNDLRELDQRIQASIARALQANNLRDVEIRRQEDGRKKSEVVQREIARKQQEKNSKPS